MLNRLHQLEAGCTPRRRNAAQACAALLREGIFDLRRGAQDATGARKTKSVQLLDWNVQADRSSAALSNYSSSHCSNLLFMELYGETAYQNG